MPQFAEVVYNITDAWVARLNLDNTYGTPVRVDYIGKVSFEYESDTDEIKSGGQIVETLTVPTKATGEITQASLDFAGMAVLLGTVNGSYSTTPNQYGVQDIPVGGEGLPYCGLIVAYASVYGGNMLAGFPKFRLDTVPGFDADQNKFRIGSANFTAIAPSVNARKVVRYKKYETAAAVPQSAANFLAFFTTPPPSLFL